nr:MAG TPA: hypothetical protein [Caudoviricetes sp.]
MPFNQFLKLFTAIYLHFLPIESICVRNLPIKIYLLLPQKYKTA